MSAPFNNTSSQDAPQTSQPLGAPITGGSTHSHSHPNPVESHGHNNSHPSAALSGGGMGIGGANPDQGNYGVNAPHHQGGVSHEGGERKEGLVDALNPTTSGGTHLPKKTGDSHSHDYDNTQNPTSHSHSHTQANPTSIAHGQQTGNTIHGAGVAPGPNQTGFRESGVAGQNTSSSSSAPHTNLDANVNDSGKPNVTDRVSGQEAGGLSRRTEHDPKDHATPGLGKDLVAGGDSYADQPGSAHASSHRHKVDPRDVDTEIGSKNMGQTPESGGGPVSVGGGMGTGENRVIPGGVKGTGGMGKRDEENAMGGGGGIVGKIAEKLGMGHGNTKTTGEHATEDKHYGDKHDSARTSL